MIYTGRLIEGTTNTYSKSWRTGAKMTDLIVAYGGLLVIALCIIAAGVTTREMILEARRQIKARRMRW
jgi:hypothetical protein